MNENVQDRIDAGVKTQTLNLNALLNAYMDQDHEAVAVVWSGMADDERLAVIVMCLELLATEARGQIAGRQN